ncbi:uncharacterized protein TNCV_788181 [Trichonephila clavipes]|nr:uncharacterized protein TNCV_788181 [Trichonephila clavipes]
MAHQTALARFRSGHLRSMTFVQGVKSFFTCPCSLLASPANLLDCWGISLRQLYEEEHDFTASKATDHDVLGDEIENNSANPQTLVVENQHINPSEEPEHMANADYDALKKPVRIFLFQTIA